MSVYPPKQPLHRFVRGCSRVLLRAARCWLILVGLTRRCVAALDETDNNSREGRWIPAPGSRSGLPIPP